MPADRSASPLAPGLLLGAGLGGFVDGIVLHQILQWHHLLSATERYPPSTVAGLEVNTLADGLFHAATWLAVAVGVALLWWRARDPGPGRWRGRSLLGPVLAGWGAFNLVEGAVNHHLLGLHHVRPGAHQGGYDIAFLVLGAALLLAGWALHRRGTERVS